MTRALFEKYRCLICNLSLSKIIIRPNAEVNTSAFFLLKKRSLCHHTKTTEGVLGRVRMVFRLFFVNNFFTDIFNNQ